MQSATARAARFRRVPEREVVRRLPATAQADQQWPPWPLPRRRGNEEPVAPSLVHARDGGPSSSPPAAMSIGKTRSQAATRPARTTTRTERERQREAITHYPPPRRRGRDWCAARATQLDVPDAEGRQADGGRKSAARKNSETRLVCASRGPRAPLEARLPDPLPRPCRARHHPPDRQRHSRPRASPSTSTMPPRTLSAD